MAVLSIHHQTIYVQISLYFCSMAGPSQVRDRQAADYLVQETCWFFSWLHTQSLTNGIQEELWYQESTIPVRV